MEAFIKFFFAHINIIIYVLGLVTVMLIGVMTFLNLGNDSEGNSSVDNNKISDLENLLKKMLDSAQTRPMPAAGVVDIEEKPAKEGTTTSAPAASQQVVVKEVDTTALNEVIAEVQTLKSAVAEKEAIIAKLKSSLELAQQEGAKKAASAPSNQMQEKMRELEAKLAEYEIIEDDIADLTMYKEENAQLKEQIKQLMKGGAASEALTPVTAAPAPAPAPAPVPEVVEAVAPAVVPEPPPTPVIVPESAPVAVPEPTPAPTPTPTPAAQAPKNDEVTDDLLEQFKQALTEKSPTPVATPPSPAPTSEPAAKESEDLMSEFENALAEQRKSESVPMQVQGPIPIFPIHGDEGGQETHDIMAEFVTDSVLEDGGGIQIPIDPPVLVTAANDPLAATDPNKMISEVESLSGQNSDASANALEGDTDTDKMLKEMEDFKKLASGS